MSPDPSYWLGVIIRDDDGRLLLQRTSAGYSGLRIPMNIPPSKLTPQRVYRSLRATFDVELEFRWPTYRVSADHECPITLTNGSIWMVYETWVNQFDPRTVTITDLYTDETPAMDWYSQNEIMPLALRTTRWRAGMITPDEWHEQPGLSMEWMELLVRVGVISFPVDVQS